VIGLSYVGRNIVSLPSFLGVQFDGKTNLSDGVALNAWVRTAWKHEFDADRSTESAFIAAPGFDFVIEGAQPPRDALVANLGAKLKFGKNTSLFASFNGDFGAGSRGYTGTGGVSVSW
jgi:outer membrane autotransporter protein